MKTIRSINCELKKSIYSVSFLICVITAFVLCFTTVCYVTTTNEEYTIYKVMRTFSHKQLLTDVTFHSFYIFHIGGGSWLSMFITIIASFPFIPVFCDERHTGNIRFSIVRQGKLRYYFAKFCASLFSGGFAVMLGYFLFGIVVQIIFPPLSAYSSNQQEFYINFYLKHGMTIAIIQQLIQMFIYGAIASLLSFTLSSFIQNKYLVMCIPFMLKYIYDQTLLKISTNAMQKQNFEFVEKLNILNSKNVLSLFQQGTIFGWIIALNIGFALVCFGLFSICMNRRIDLGA